jgi:hypothetical protein
MALCLPLAVLLGYFLAEPMDSGSFAVIILVLALLAVPVMMNWYHPLLILSWNLYINPNFLPGRPALWMLVAVAGLMFAILNRAVKPDRQFLLEPSVTSALVFLSLVVVITAALTGGFGFHSLGGATYGGKNYFQVGAAIIGFFTLCSVRIKPERANFYIGIFFLANLTALIPNLIYKAGAGLFFLYEFFPPDIAADQAAGDYSMNHLIVRVTGLTLAAPGLYYFLLARYGLRGTFDLWKPWRAGLFLLAFIGCLTCGFRSALIVMGLTMAVFFVFDGLLKTRATVMALGLAALGAVFLVGFAEHLPLAAQRTISFLPIKVDPIAMQDATMSTQWRVDMWRLVLPEVPKYLLKGKGYAINPDDIEIAQQGNAFSSVIAAGDYHNGPLSVIMPFGLFGFIGFVWFLGASIRYLYRCQIRGDSRLKTINTFLLSLFIARSIAFFVVFGSLYSDLWVFVGIIGMSISLNGVIPEQEEIVSEESAILELAS